MLPPRSSWSESAARAYSAAEALPLGRRPGCCGTLRCCRCAGRRRAARH
ncbi:MAG: hypothetical protein LBE67_18600 [Kocuria palustris]|nr:hypothetical protein [Kocuria palustris]